jgi:cytochrome c
MDSFEFNKIFAAVLVAGITAMFAGFIAELVVHPHALETDAVFVEGAPLEGAGGTTVAMPEPILGLIAAADVAQGEKLSKACASCHSFEKGGPVKTGPNLWNVVGGAKAHVGSFAYSDGLKGMGGNWSYAELNKFLWKPKKFIPDTKMTFVGLKKPEDRAAMIAWLRTLSDSPKGMPGASEIAAEEAELAPPVAEEAAADAPAADSGDKKVQPETAAH